MTGGDISGGLPGETGYFLGVRSTKPTEFSDKVTFADVAGQDEAKREVCDLVEFLRDPDRFQKVGAIARSMVARWGVDPDIGPVDLRESEDHPFLGQQIIKLRTFADETAARVDQAVMKLLHAAENQATQLIGDHRDQVSMLVARLEAQETLDLDDINGCLEPDEKARPFVKKRKSGKPAASELRK